jgi:hypothetical protein
MMTIEPDEKEIWLTVHEVAKVRGKSLRQVQYYAAAKPGERPLLQVSGDYGRKCTRCMGHASG